MSKVDELREKYRRVSDVTFSKILAGDKTPTKKYSDYMLRMWTLKLEGVTHIPSAEALIREVNLFDSLLIHNTINKDIYSTTFRSYNSLVHINKEVGEIKDEKSFNKDEHIVVIYEDDNFLMVEPKTHRGSLKYGANSRWCTAAKNADATFKNYARQGCLVYIINKNKEKDDSKFGKLAFYGRGNNPLIGNITIYNQVDSEVSEDKVVNSGWDQNELYQLILRFRMYHVQWLRIKIARDKVQSTIDVLQLINLVELHENLHTLKQFKSEKSLAETAQKKLEEFLKEIGIPQ